MILTVGKITKPHGIRGEVVVEVRTDDPVARFAAGSVLITDPGQSSVAVSETLTVVVARPHKDRMIVRFDGVEDRNAADALRGVLVGVDSRDLDDGGDPDEFHDHELVGLAAVDAEGTPLGTVLRVEHAPASDLLVLRQVSGKISLVPFVKAMVPHVDVAGGRVVLTPPEGLLDL